MKHCPQCNSVDVPEKVEICPFCGYEFIEKKEELFVITEGETKPQSLEMVSSNIEIEDMPKPENIEKIRALENEIEEKRKLLKILTIFLISLIIADTQYVETVLKIMLIVIGFKYQRKKRQLKKMR